ncbi:MAG: HPr family phosphocarrier protein [Clostridia bacterium]|nr:HPr family phosphocarrier protein [Clostridia bacterium]
MVSEKVILREALDLVSIDQLVKELKAYPKTQVTVVRRGYDVDGRDAIKLGELHAVAGDELTVRCVGREERACLRAAVSMLA